MHTPVDYNYTPNDMVFIVYCWPVSGHKYEILVATLFKPTQIIVSTV